MTGTCPQNTHELRRQWKRTARHWARPYPVWFCTGANNGGVCWLATIFLVGLALPAVYYYLGDSNKSIEIYSGRFPMLHILDKAVSPSAEQILEAISGDLSETLQMHPHVTPAFAAPQNSKDKTVVTAITTSSNSTTAVTTTTATTEDTSPSDETRDPTTADHPSPDAHTTDASQPSSPKSSKAWQDEAVASTSNPPKACLALIMKNEGPILPRLFESIKGFASAYCVVDTGSTDDTIDVLRSIDMPGMLVEEPFVDFATTRNFLLDTCRQRTTCEYLLLLDADMKLRVSPEWSWVKLDDKDVYDFVQISGLEYANVRMIKRSADKIKVVGATHEYYDVPAEYSHKLLPKDLIHIDDVGDGKAKGDKFERDERLLKRELVKDPNNVRTVFYLANTLKDQGKYKEAIPYYERRATMGGWYAEADYSWFQLSTCYLALGDFAKGREYAMRAAYRGWHKRAEPLYFLAFYLHKRGEYELAWHYATLAGQIPKPAVSTVLFISYTIYDYWIAYEQASLCRHVFPAEPRFCLEKAVAFQNNAHVPEDLIEYHYPDMKEIVRPILQEGDSKRRVLYSQNVDGQANGRNFASLATMRTSNETEKGGHRMELLVPLPSDEQAKGQVLYQVLSRGSDSDSPRELGDVHARFEEGHAAPANLKFMGQTALVGYSTDASTLFMGEWNGLQQEHEQALINLNAYTITTPFHVEAPWTLFQAPDGTSYCITQWHPSIDIGYLKVDKEFKQARCEFFKSIHNVPRSFSFFRGTWGPAVADRGDELWVMVHSRRADADMLSIVVLSLDFELRGYTVPFILRPWKENMVTSSIQMVFEGTGMDEAALFLYETEASSAKRTTLHADGIPLNWIRTMMIAAES